MCRALLDSGSTATFVTEDLVNRLNLVKRSCAVVVNTVGNNAPQEVKGCVLLCFSSISNIKSKKRVFIQALVLPVVVKNLPTESLSMPAEIFEGKFSKTDFADPEWNVSRKIDVLLGADAYHSVVTGKNASFGSLSLIGTVFGFAVLGPIPVALSCHITTCASQIASITDSLVRFWEIEEIPGDKIDLTEGPAFNKVVCKTLEEKFAEDNFSSTCQTDSEGRLTTTLPFFGDVTTLGNSAGSARLRFINLERKLEKTPVTYSQYRAFMQEFIDLGHMELVPDNELDLPANKSYYIPHHCVHKEESTTTKLRVVFDASAKSSTGVALNDVLAAGPNQQDNLFHIMIRFRFHMVALCGDIAKMYRQIGLDKDAKDYHRIFWRNSSSEPLQVYRMTRVTYGVKSASHSAIKALIETGVRLLQSESILAGEINSEDLKNLIRALQDFYVDDWMSGDRSIEKARELVQLIRRTLSAGCFELRKFASSCPEIVNELAPELRESVEAFEFSDKDHLIKTLGVAWQPIDDAFEFKVKHIDSPPESAKDVKRAEKALDKRVTSVVIPFQDEYLTDCLTVVSFTRRQILSDLAKIFDPLGLLSPVVVTLKISMQEIWRTNLGWDDPLPPDIVSPYLKWRNSLTLIRDFQIPRRVFHYATAFTELHVFCDASTKAYGAVVYVRYALDSEPNSVHCNMLTSKCKVAPLKQLTVPKLELCAALTGVRLLEAVLYALRNLEVSPTVFAWSDSTTVLHWIANLPGRWQTFVANRVSQIQEVVARDHWFHIPTELNPADLVSRGVTVEELLVLDFWWKGPTFLREPVFRLPPQPTDEEAQFFSEEEKRPSVTVLAVSRDIALREERTILNVVDISKYTSLLRLLNVTSVVIRFVDVLMKRTVSLPPESFVTVFERRVALQKLVYGVQRREFFDEIRLISGGHQVSGNSTLIKLYPFIDEDDQLLRVGGRLHATDLLQSQKYPAILPKKSNLSRLLALNTHTKTTFHGGLNMCVGELRRSFWIISSRQLFREIVRNCVRCFRFNSKPRHALMGDLPQERVTPSLPFTHTGLDFAGPIAATVEDGKTPGVTRKLYLAIFVCFSTKAIHIEVVSSLTSQDCIAAISRFVARRGLPVRMYSDNATNFTGSRIELARLQGLLHAKKGVVSKEFENQGMEWVFIPPASPNFGGLWEAAVKGAKGHIKKVVGKAVLSFEELTTLCCDIEAMMNSRPLVPVSEDPNDLGALTPFLLLTGRQSKTLPLLPIQRLKSVDLIKANPTKRWIHLRNMSADFWKRWTREYLTTLQQRPKHNVERPNLQKEDLVLLTDERSAPLLWPLGRVLEVFPGNDGQVRAVLVRTATGTYRRPAYKARKLPINETFFL